MLCPTLHCFARQPTVLSQQPAYNHANLKGFRHPFLGIAMHTKQPKKHSMLRWILQRCQPDTREPETQIDPYAILPNTATATQGSLYMFIAAMLWGSNPVALRYVTLTGTSPGPAALTILHAGLAGVILTVVLSLGAFRGADRIGQDVSPIQPQPVSTPQTPLARYLNSLAPTIELAAVELGILAATANAFTVLGFQHSPATHGAFLFRLSAAATPVVAWLAGDTLQARIWFAAALALSGSLLLALDPVEVAGAAEGALGGTQGTLGPVSFGDAALMVAALLWSVQIVRVGRYARTYPPLKLASKQLLCTAAASLPLLAFECTLYVTGVNTNSPLAVPAYSNVVAWMLLLYPAVGPWGLGSLLQYKAQGGQVSPSVATIILATDPLWTALFAGILGGAEQHLGFLGLVGAVLILSASLLAGRYSGH